MKESKKRYLPISYKILLSKDMCLKTQIERHRMEKIPYTLDIGSIMYVMLCIRLDASYTLSITIRYQLNPNKSHWKIVKTILMYLRTPNNVFLVYKGDGIVVHGYLDVSFQ